MTEHCAVLRAGPSHQGCRRAVSGLSLVLLGVLSVAAGLAGAQQPATGPGQTQVGLPEPVGESKAGPRPNWVITPSISVDGTYTDNVNLAANKKADFVTRLSPGIDLDGKSGRASATLNYRWQHYAYAENSARDNNQRSLAAKGRLELVDDWLFVEGSQNISQQAVSAFGTQSVGNELINGNRSETAAYSISPYIQGRLAGIADYQLRYSGSHTRSDSGVLAGGTAATTRSWTGRLAGATPLASLGWIASIDQRVIRNTNNSESRSRHAVGTLTYQIDPQLRVLVSAGNESDNFTSALQQKRTTTGLGVDWAPTERTSISLRKDRNSSGNPFSIDFSHRTALTAWKFSNSRSISIPTPQLALVSTGTAYDLLYQQLASSFPDPLARAAEANRQLARAGIPADAPIFGPLLTSQAFVQRRQQASVALSGVNNTVILAADRSSSERLGTGLGLADDFAGNSNIRQSGFNTSWAHKMTPRDALTLNVRSSRSTGSGNLETSLKAWSLLLTTQLGASTSASVGLRQSRFDSTAATGYDERALTGYLLHRF